MINLIKAEIYKIFHKKSTFITLIIGFLFLFLVNILYQNLNTLMFKNYQIYINSAEDSLKEIDSTNSDTINLNTEIRVYSLLKDYHHAWQEDMILNDYYSLAYNYYNALFYHDSNVDSYLNLLNNFEEKIKNNDLAYFINEKLDESKNLLKEYENNEINMNSEELAINKEMENRKIELYNYVLNHPELKSNDYLYNAYSEMVRDLNTIINYEKNPNEEDKEIVKNYYENKYILDNNTDTKENSTIRMVFLNLYSECEIIILVFIIMIAGGIISEEFNKGTIKNLLTLPFERWKIYFAKLIAALLMLPFIAIFLFLSELIIGGLLYGYSSLSIPFVSYSVDLGKYYTLNAISYYFLIFSSKLPMLILLLMLSFSLSTIILSTSFSITITFLGYLASSIINSFITYPKLAFLKFFVTPNWDFSYYLFGLSSPYNISIERAIITCIIYFLIMLIGSLIVFKKRNIKNI